MIDDSFRHPLATLAAAALCLAVCQKDPPVASAPTAGTGEASLERRTTPPEVSRPQGPRRIIDTHAHLFGPDVWEGVAPVMETNQIAYFVNLSGGSPRRRMSHALALSEASGDRVLNAMTINWQGFGEPAFGQIVADELALCVREYGYIGLKVSKALGLGVTDEDGQLVAVNDERLFPIWERAGELGRSRVYSHSRPARILGAGNASQRTF